MYRAFGADAKGYGRSWSRVNPVDVDDYANAAGLPSKKGITGYSGGQYNSGGFVAEGRVVSTKGVQVKTADPLHGKSGGIDELVFLNPSKQIEIERVYGVNPPLNP